MTVPFVRALTLTLTLLADPAALAAEVDSPAPPASAVRDAGTTGLPPPPAAAPAPEAGPIVATPALPPELPTIAIESGARIRPLRHAFCHLQGDPRFSLSGDGVLSLDVRGVGARAELLYGDCRTPQLAAIVGVGRLDHPPEDAELALDQSEVEIHGPKLPQRTAWWRLGSTGRFNEAPLTEGVSDGRANSHFALPREVSVRALSPSEGPLQVIAPPEGMPSPDVPSVELWDKRGVPVPLDAFRIPISRFVLDRPPLREVPLDAWREQSEIPVTWPGAIAHLSCPNQQCRLSGDESWLLVTLPPAGDELKVELTLRDAVYLRTPRGLTQQATLTLALAHCQVKPLLPVVLSGLADHHVPIQLAGNCPEDLSELSVETQPASEATVVSVGAHQRIDVSLGLVPRGAQVLRLTLRAGPRRAVLGTATIPMSDSWTFTRAALYDKEVGEIDVVPTNRPVEVRVLAQDFRVSGDLNVEPLPGFYRVLESSGAGGVQRTLIEGVAQSGGSVPILVGYRPKEANLPPEAPPLVVFQALPGYQVREVSVPVELAPEKPQARRLLQIICHDSNGGEHLISQGQIVNLPHDARHACRLVIDKSVLSPENGPQRLRLTIAMTRPDTTPAPGSFSKTIQVRPGPGTESLWLDPTAPVQEFEHMRVTLAHDDPGHFYLGSQDALSGAGFTAVSVELIFGNSHVRLYGSAAIPTGLYRINGPQAGALNFSAGALIRLAALDRRGMEFPFDMEFGIFGTGISQTANLSFMFGPGLTVPILNPGQPAQASVGIHAWLEYAPTMPGPIRDRFAVIFGPSVSVGDFGANF